MNNIELVKKVKTILDGLLKEKKIVCAIGLFLGLGYLSPTILNDWRRGRILYLEKGLQVNLSKLTLVMKEYRRWALEQGLLARETAYVQHATRNTIHLRFSKSGQANIETNYRTHYISSALTLQKQQRLIDKIERSRDSVVYIILTDSTCSQCKAPVHKGAFLLVEEDKPLCMKCSPYKDFIFLPAGNALLTRRAKKYSSQQAVVVTFSSARKRYERQGLLIEESAYKQAKIELESNDS
jgi:hypothetical protein